MVWTKYKLKEAEHKLYQELENLIRQYANMLASPSIDKILDDLENIRREARRALRHL